MLIFASEWEVLLPSLSSFLLALLDPAWHLSCGQQRMRCGPVASRLAIAAYAFHASASGVLLLCGCCVVCRWIEERSFRRTAEICLERTIVVYVELLLQQVSPLPGDPGFSACDGCPPLARCSLEEYVPQGPALGSGGVCATGASCWRLEEGVPQGGGVCATGASSWRSTS